MPQGTTAIVSGITANAPFRKEQLLVGVIEVNSAVPTSYPYLLIAIDSYRHFPQYITMGDKKISLA
jgi:hypothetical protein